MVAADRRQHLWLAVFTLYSFTCNGLPMAIPGQKVQAAGPAPDLANFTRAGCDNFTGNTWQPLRPAYHITAPFGWINDPHGMFQLKNTVHLFFQYNPRDMAWGAPFWGHVVSQDLAHWTWLPPALLPDTQYDFNGVWSGAATMADGDVPILTYTAAGTQAPEMGNYFQRQAMAVPADMKDPYLKKWVKPATNPFLAQIPPGGTNFQFRDPTEGRHAVWLAMTSPDNPQPFNKSHYALAVGTQAYCLGGAGIYTAPTMAGPWSYVGSLYNQLVPEPQIDGQCMASPTSSSIGWPGPAYGGPCDQFGAYCRMWEVVDFAELENGLFFLKWDDQSHFRSLFSMEWYVLGNGPWDWAAIHPDLVPTTSSQDKRKPNEFGKAYSGYPNEADLSKPPTASKRNQDDDFNQIDNWDKSAKRSLFTGKVDGQRFAPMRTDYGSTYASMVFRTEDKRQIMFSWIYETAAGCTSMCSEEMPEAIKRQGFKGAHTLPRQLSYDPVTKTLKGYPVPETSSLRGKVMYNASNAALATFPQVTTLLHLSTVPGVKKGGSSSSTKLSASSVTARQFEVQANFTLLPPGSRGSSSKVVTEAGHRRMGGKIVKQPDEFAFGVRIELGSSKFADAYVKGTVRSLAPQSPAYAISSLSVWFDRSHAGGDTNTTFLEGGPVPLPVNQDLMWKAPDTPLALSVWVDHGVVEIFAMQGLARLTSRIYPDDDTVAWGTSAWSIPPDPTAGVAVDRAAAAKAAEALRPPTVLSGMYCWWCRMWSSPCQDQRCFSGISRWPEPGDWGALFDGQVWEMKSAWLPPSC